MNAPQAAVRVRTGTARDLEFILRLGRVAAAADISSQRPVSPAVVAGSFERLMQQVVAISHVLFIAETAAEPVGFLVLLDQFADEVSGAAQAFVAYVAVEPHARGRGVGRMLLEAAEAWARRAGLPALTLMVSEENESARSLYASLGLVTERRLLCKRL